MKIDRLKVRRWLMVLLTLGVFGVFVARLLDIQIVHAADYQKDQVFTSVQTVKATRGEIVDRNGVSLVSNRLGYDVIIDKVFFPGETQNDILLRLIGLFEEAGEEWNDNLPISHTKPYRFLPGFETEASLLKAQLKVQDYATEEDTMFRLLERYNLTDYDDDDARKVAGVRYEMERRGFATNVPYTFATDIDIDLVLRIKERNYLLSGVDVIESAIRSYDLGDIAPHLIGRIGPIYAEEYPALKEKGYAMDDTVGKSGVESAFEEYLRGKNGKRDIILDSGGQVVQATETQPPVPGNTVVLTIDSELQREAQLALEAQIKHLQNTAPAGEGKEANSGAVVAIHVPTGQVLVAATYPSFNLNTYLQDYAALAADTTLNPLYNRALQGLYAPGSCFKPIVGTAGLASGVIAEGSTVYCGHVYTRFQDYQPRCLGSHGNITLARALSLSCNIFFYDTGWNAGIEQVDKISSQYGMGEPTGIELYEETGHRSNPQTAEALGKEWNDGDVLQSSIGQLYNSFTPLQLANYTATIANRGKRMKATIVKEIADYARENVLQPSQPTVAQTVDANPEDFEAVIKGMVSASRAGTAVAHFSNYPIDVASKTGTPESATEPNSTFICFAPAEKPEIAIAVVIEKGWHGYTGAPVAKAVMDMYFGIPNPNPLVPKEAGQMEGSAANPPVSSSQAETPSSQGAQTSENSQDSVSQSEASASEDAA